MTWSEFGLRVPENASGGADYGAGSMLFVMGAGVKGGLYGDPPNLVKLDDGNLRFATDFRSVYDTLLEGWLGVDPVAAMGQAFPRLGFL